MVVLVTGANGQLGRCIQDVVKSKLHCPDEYIFADRQMLDITDKEAVEAFVKGRQVDVIVNCAAYTNVDGCEDSDIAEAINVSGPEILGEMGTKMIHISTDYVFSGKLNRPYPETVYDGEPGSKYGRYKYHGELALLRNNKNAIIIRTSWLYSKYGKNFVKTIDSMLADGNKKLSVVYDQIGTPTYGMDLARVIVQIIEAKDWTPGIYHYSNEGVCSWFDFAKAIVDLRGYRGIEVEPIESKQYSSDVQRPNYSVLSKDKIKSIYDVHIPYWRDSLSDCLKELSR